MKETIATPSAPAAVNEVYARVFPPPFPAHSCVQVADMFLWICSG